MIFVTLGSQKFQFNRLLKAIDELVERRKIKEEVFAQIGYSDYQPINYKYKQFLDRDEFVAIVNDETVEILDEKKETLVRKTIKYNKDSTNDLLLEIAVGYSKYKFGDKSYEQILKRSDDEMYKHKEQLKERSSIKSIR